MARVSFHRYNTSLAEQTNAGFAITTLNVQFKTGNRWWKNHWKGWYRWTSFQTCTLKWNTTKPEKTNQCNFNKQTKHHFDRFCTRTSTGSSKISITTHQERNMPQNIREKSLHCSVLVMAEPVLSNYPCERASVLRDNNLGGYNDGLHDRWHPLTFKTSERSPLFSRKQASRSKQVALYFEACSSVGHFLPYYSEVFLSFFGSFIPQKSKVLGPTSAVVGTHTALAIVGLKFCYWR